MIIYTLGKKKQEFIEYINFGTAGNYYFIIWEWYETKLELAKGPKVQRSSMCTKLDE